MNNQDRIITIGKETIQIEADCLRKLKNKIDDNFAEAVNLILSCKGRIVVTGVGKSGIIGKKITSTLASTGTPSFFIHSGEGGHGDIGMIMSGDVVIAISYSGETEEIISLLPAIKRLGVKIITITGNKNSNLAKFSDIVLDVKVDKEACPMGLAPTSSSAATLAMGDAIAVALIAEKKITSDDFALYHPAGSIGRNLLLTVNDIMYKEQDIPLVTFNTLVKDALYIISSKRLGTTGVIDGAGKLIGIFTDGDLRRLISQGIQYLNEPIKKFMTKNPRIIKASALAAEALFSMNKLKITSLFIINDDKEPVGIIHMHDILAAGIK
ncbi:MAG TPA: KpsF/GutQ family sugar-phosphate isomerase [bacterium]|nr:KpsF/GutQ family sugar-phosphate isomerase [bacterium]